MLPSMQIKMRRGKKDEIKILSTTNKKKIVKQLILIRKFVGLDVKDSNTKIYDERGHRIRIEENDIDHDNKID